MRPICYGLTVTTLLILIPASPVLKEDPALETQESLGTLRASIQTHPSSTSTSNSELSAPQSNSKPTE